MNHELQELSSTELDAVAGGFYFDDFCGTVPRPWWPRPRVIDIPVLVGPLGP